MAVRASSLAVRGESPARVAREFEHALSQVDRPTGAVVFTSGSLSRRLEDVGAALARATDGVPVLIVSGAGVLTERGEVEDESAAAGIVWSGGEAEALAVPGSTGEQATASLGALLERRIGRRQPAGLVFVKPDGFGPQALEPLQHVRGLSHLLGGGTVGEPGVCAVDRERRVTLGSGGLLLMHGLSPPAIRVSPACRLLMPLRQITEARSSMVLRIEDEGALEVLSAVGEDLLDQPLVFAVLAEEAEATDTDPDARPPLMVRAVQGVDPVRGGLLVSEEVRPGMRIAFAVRDAQAARADFDAMLRSLERDLAGGAPQFGIFLNCAGRGSALYGSPDVDTRAVRGRFNDLPLAGMQSSFEIAPYAGRPTLQLYTGVLALFSAPS